MELIDVLLILGVFLPLFFVAVWQLNRINPTKKAGKAGDSSVKSMYGVYTQQVTDVLKLKDKQISSLMAKNRLLEEEEEYETTESLDINALKPIAEKLGIDPAILELPFIKDKIAEYTKGMTMNDLLSLADKFGKTKGSTEPKSDIEGEKDPNVTYI